MWEKEEETNAPTWRQVTSTKRWIGWKTSSHARFVSCISHWLIDTFDGILIDILSTDHINVVEEDSPEKEIEHDQNILSRQKHSVSTARSDYSLFPLRMFNLWHYISMKSESNRVVLTWSMLFVVLPWYRCSLVRWRASYIPRARDEERLELVERSVGGIRRRMWEDPSSDRR